MVLGKLHWKSAACPVRVLYFPGMLDNLPWLRAQGYLEERKRVTLVPQTGQAPWAILRPLEVSLTAPFFTVRFVRHFTQ